MSFAQQLQWALLVEGGSRTLYFIGNRPASPKPKSVGRWRYSGQPEPEWVRPWLKNTVARAVFLSPTPVSVFQHHGVTGHVYAYSVPQWVIKEAGGLHRFDHATEIVVPDVLWKHVKFLGKSMDKQEFDDKIRKSSNEAGYAAFNLKLQVRDRGKAAKAAK